MGRVAYGNIPQPAAPVGGLKRFWLVGLGMAMIGDFLCTSGLALRYSAVGSWTTGSFQGVEVSVPRSGSSTCHPPELSCVSTFLESVGAKHTEVRRLVRAACRDQDARIWDPLLNPPGLRVSLHMIFAQTIDDPLPSIKSCQTSKAWCWLG